MPPATPDALRRAVETERESGVEDARVFGELGPMLMELLRTSSDERVLRSALLALGRIGDEPARPGKSPSHAAQIAKWLSHPSAYVSEAAVQALGWLGDRNAAVILAALVRDQDPGRELCGEHEVPIRIRALAAGGLGMIGARASSLETRRFAVHYLTAGLADRASSYPDLASSCVIALGLVRLDGEVGDRASSQPAHPSFSLEAEIEHLIAVLENEALSLWARGHVPLALARLARGADPALRDRVVEGLLELADPDRRTRHEILAGALFALGELGDCDEDELDARIRASLRGSAMDGDPRRSSLAALALGEVAGRAGSGKGEPLAAAGITADFLADRLERAKGLSRPWIGLGLGVLGHGLRAQGRELPSGARAALARALEHSSMSEQSGAFVLAAGLSGVREVSPVLVDRMDESTSTQRARAVLALGLAGESTAMDSLRELCADAIHEPILFEEGALARALLSDPELESELLEALPRCECNHSTQGVAGALAWVGGVESFDALLARASEGERSSSERALCIESLGWLAAPKGPRSAVEWTRGVNLALLPPVVSHPTETGWFDAL